MGNNSFSAGKGFSPWSEVDFHTLLCVDIMGIKRYNVVRRIVRNGGVNMFKKKIISCILAFTVAVCSAASISAFATEGTYDLDSGETVSSEALTEGNVVIYN